jgi:hypothetical protein
MRRPGCFHYYNGRPLPLEVVRVIRQAKVGDSNAAAPGVGTEKPELIAFDCRERQRLEVAEVDGRAELKLTSPSGEEGDELLHA